ncbi:hypothetical protein [Streptomyces sp. NPDC091278]|uniref:hypothetical protein n=1 Tax=Streptomyces sp. NPDC091278 TaxID=3155301 RepID=UPI00344FBC60
MMVDAERLQAMPGSVPLIGDEVGRMGLGQRRGVVASARHETFEVGAQLHASPAELIEAGSAAGRVRLQPGGQEVPEQVPQPALCDSAQVDSAAGVGEADAEVFGLDEPGVLGVLAGEVNQP